MAPVTRKEFAALTTRVAALEAASGTTPTPDPTPPQTGIVLAKPTVAVKGTSYTIQALVSTFEPATFTYLQLAVRGPGATDLARTPGATMLSGDTKLLLGSGSGTGTFTAYLAYSKDGTTWVDGPKVTFTTTGSTPDPVTPPSGDGFPLVGASGLNFNSIVFRQSRADAEAFGNRRGTPMDGLLYFTGRQNWGDFRWHPDGQADWLAQGKIVVTSMPHAPESEGGAMNDRGADDAYRDEQRALGKSIADSGLNYPTHVIRVDWECNGNWYAWNAGNGASGALKQAIRNYVTNLRAGGATKVKFNLCFNKGPSQTGHDYDIFPGADVIDILGIDEYDMWSPSFNEADWEREMAKGPSPRTNAAFAAEQGIWWSWDEGGNTHGDNNQGGDNPVYWQLVHDEIQRLKANCAYHNTYDDRGAPSTLMHDFDSNPRSFAVYKKLWTPS